MSEAAAIADPVLFAERAAAGGYRIGIATLNSPQTLNGLSLPMVRLLDARLRDWAGDATIACVVLQGAGDKAFCAGGDLHGLYQSMRARDASDDILGNDYAAAFFAEEYRLDYRIHRYPKPLLCWGHGIVMGGGIGLMAGAGYRVVSERSRLAFPEIGIGLFPDVGGSWLLRRVPDGAGLFLALTGAPLNAGDAIHAGLADVCVEASRYPQVLERLCEETWSGDPASDQRRLGRLLSAFARVVEPGPLQQHGERIARIVQLPTLEQVVAAIMALDSADRWLCNAQASLRAGAPGSLRLSWTLQRERQLATLADSFRDEYMVALHAAAHGDFAEGIRALLIDKDRQPRWHPATLAAADAAWTEGFFAAPWPAAAHPLANLI